jgi:DNA-binding CsgD family transcriptional regulator
VTVIVGVDGSGRTHRLNQIAAAADRAVLRINPPVLDVDRLAADLAAAGESLVLVDDAHRLTPDELAILIPAARRGVSIVVARRPTLPSRAHADLDEAIAGRVEQLDPLDVDGVGGLASALTGRPVTPDAAARLHAETGGLPAIVAAVVQVQPGQPSPALVARLQRRLAQLNPAVAGLARLLALRLDLPDAVLAAAAASLDGDSAGADLGSAMRELRDEGTLVSGGETMIPAVAEAVLADLAATQRRRLHEAVARALVAAGADPLIAATQLRAARAFIPAAAGAFVAAGDRARFDDPAAALAWYEDAIDAGEDPTTVAAGRAEAAAMLGLPVDAPAGVPAAHAARAAAVAGAVEAHHGRSARAAEALVGAGPLGALLAVPSLVAVGDLDAARAVLEPGGGGDAAPLALRRLAEAALTAASDPGRSVPLFIEAAEAAERTPPAAVLPDTAHGLGALLASAAGDTAAAEHLLDRATATGSGGQVFAGRYRALLAWVRMRAGRYDTAVALLAGADPATTGPAALTGRERLLTAALSAGIARRSGDVAALRDAWQGIEPVLARRAVDLFTAEAVEELAVAATRLRQYPRVVPVLEALDEFVRRLGYPAAWVVTVGWIRVQVAIAAEDATAAAAAADRIAEGCRTATGARQRAQCSAAALWARVLGGDVDPDAATVVAAELAAVDLPWEGSRLVGQAAIRTGDASAARRLLERARDLSSAEVVTEKSRSESSHGGLSEREVEVARMVLAGGTYREIGARLFISPKTVEHHVARIRTKVGATTRAEFVAALRTVLGAAGDGA